MSSRVRGQFQGFFDEFFTMSEVRDVASIAAGAEAVETFTVPGVALGDQVLSLGASVSLAGLNANAYVSAANVVSVQLGNATAGAIDLASATWKALVGRPSALVK